MSDFAPEAKATPPPQATQDAPARDTPSEPRIEDRTVPWQVYESATHSIEGQEGQFISAVNDPWEALARNPRVSSTKLVGVAQRLGKFADTLRDAYAGALKAVK